jgi:hypothetical protein
MKMSLLRARTSLLAGDAEQARAEATSLVARADELGVPRYSSVGRMVAHQAGAALGDPPDPATVLSDLAAVERTVRLEAWWWAGETGAALGDAGWIDRAETLADELARSSGEHGDALRAEADERLAGWRLRTR